MLSRYPDMPAEEANEYIGKIEHEENIPICHAILGRINKDTLEDDARQTFEEFQRWSEDRTHRFCNDQWNARRRQKETRTALRLTQLHEQGIIPPAILLMYGISGELPERNAYLGMSPEEREHLWNEKMETRFGPNWGRMFNSRQIQNPFQSPFWRCKYFKVDWLKEGF